MRAAVTGAAGFAGTHLVETLSARGDEVVALVRRPGADGPAARRIVVDLLDAEAAATALAESRPDVIFHLAATQSSVGRSWDRPGSTIGGDVTMAVNVLDAARSLEPLPRVLVVSSAEVYGAPEERDLPLREEAPLRPESPYGQSKLLVESIAAFYAERLACDVVVARPFNHIGPGQRPPFVVPALAEQVARGEGTIRVGNVAARRDFSDVRDVVRAYATIADEARPGDVVNVASGRALSIGDVLSRLLGLAGVDAEVDEDPALKRPSDAPLVVGDASRARSLGWEPAIAIEQTLRDVLSDARAAL